MVKEKDIYIDDILNETEFKKDVKPKDDSLLDDFSYKSDTSFSGDGEFKDNAIMSQFFDLNRQLKNIELKWKGLTIINNKPERTHRAIGPDRFVDELITSITSVVSQHSSISTIDSDGGNYMLWEKFDSFSRACISEPEFQWSMYPIIKDEYDHILQLFMGHVIDSHGIRSAERLQSGVSGEVTAQNTANQSIYDLGKSILLGGQQK